MPLPQLTKPGPKASAQVLPLPCVELGMKAPDCRFIRPLGYSMGESSEVEETRLVIARRAMNVGRVRWTMLGSVLWLESVVEER